MIKALFIFNYRYNSCSKKIIFLNYLFIFYSIYAIISLIKNMNDYDSAVSMPALFQERPGTP